MYSDVWIVFPAVFKIISTSRNPAAWWNGFYSSVSELYFNDNCQVESLDIIIDYR